MLWKLLRYSFQNARIHEYKNTKQLQMLRSLVSLNENLKNQENLFKANCKKQRTELQAEIDKLKQEVSSGKNPEAEAVDKSFAEDVDKLKKFKAHVAKKNRV